MKHKNPKRFAHETWEEFELKEAKRPHFALVTVSHLQLEADSNNQLHVSRSKF